MAGAAVSNRFPLDDVLLVCEQEAGKVGLSKHGVGHRSGVVGLLFNEELDVLEPEGMLGGVGTALVVFAWPEEEEEGDPSEVADCDISWGGYLGCGVQGLDDSDMEGPHYCWRRIFLMIGRQLASQIKVELPHAVVAGIIGPHGCKDLTNRAKVLLDRSLLDRLPFHGQKAGTYALG